jgi:hypothetical protein
MKWMRHRHTALALAVAAWTAPALAIDTADPAVMARQIFALYGKDKPGFDLRGPDAPKVIAPSLLALIRADDAAAKGEVGALGFDPFCACQDYDITAARPTVKATGLDKVEVTIPHRNFGEARTIRLSMVRTTAGWQVADIHHADTPSLVAYLRRALKRS